MKGIGASPGISIGRAHVIQKNETIATGILLISEQEISEAIAKFDGAVKASAEEIETLKIKLESARDVDGMDILDTQIEFLTDPQIRLDVVRKIQGERKNASDAVLEVVRDVVQLFRNMKDEYMSARSADLQDMGNRILKHLNGSFQTVQVFEPNTIIIAEDIAPSDTVTMDIRHVIGFATQAGGKTSHAAIIAKSRGIPAVVGCGEGLKIIQNNDVIAVDGTTGMVEINPDEETIIQLKIKQKAFFEKSSLLKSLKSVPTITTDGKSLKLLANIGNPEELEQVFENGGVGVGLLRTELLFMNRDSFPTEEEQFDFYKKVALKSRNIPITIRTIDIGGDKNLSYFDLPPEQNPFLGYRAIRICLDRKDIFMTQLKAILRASAFGNLKIMFPMICNIQEIRSAKAVLAEARAELESGQISFDKNIEVGIMIEIPSAAVTADILAKEVDFFSIGTNDLCQYTLAVDRMNEKIKDMYDPFNPGVLRLIHNVIIQAHKNGIHVALCGELASDPLATLLLMGMGLEEFSMSAISIPYIKNIMIRHSMADSETVLNKVMEMESSQDIKSYLEGVNK